jgi:hypothetical protein
MSTEKTTNAGGAALIEELVSLLTNFQAELKGDDLRRKVQTLIPVHTTLAKLGQSLIPSEVASSARDRLLHYFRKYPYTILPREELAIVGAIAEWARRVRELRVEHGWAILSGKTAKEMAEEGEFPVEVNVSSMGPDDYILISTEQDRDAAFRWRTARDLRNKQGSIRDRILEYLRRNVGRQITGEELRYIAKDRTEWARRTRELRTEYGWPVLTKASGRPDLPVGVYILEEDRQSPPHDRKIPDAVRREVLRRDEYRCRRCDWHHDLWNRSDPRHLELHHIKEHVAGGANTKGNLITLCTVCHDLWHDFDGDERAQGFNVWLGRENPSR